MIARQLPRVLSLTALLLALFAVPLLGCGDTDGDGDGGGVDMGATDMGGDVADVPEMCDELVIRECACDDGRIGEQTCRGGEFEACACEGEAWGARCNEGVECNQLGRKVACASNPQVDASECVIICNFRDEGDCPSGELCVSSEWASDALPRSCYPVCSDDDDCEGLGNLTRCDGEVCRPG